MGILNNVIARANARRAAQLAAQTNGSDNNDISTSTASATPVMENVEENSANTPKAEESSLNEYDSNCISYSGKTRFRGGDWAERVSNAKITIIGAGGIGSWTALEASRMGASEIIVADGDTVEDVNLAGQMYRVTDIGSHKVHAVSRNIRAFCPNCNLVTIPRFVNQEDDHLFHPVTVTALDSMSARKMMWEIYKKTFENLSDEDKKGCLFVDGRMNADTVQIFAFRMNETDKIKLYEETALFSEEQADATVCSYKATSYMSTLIGSLIGGIIKQHFSAAELEHKWTIPLFTEMSSERGWTYRTTNDDWRA